MDRRGLRLRAGSIERRYVGCGEDNDDTARRGNTTDTADQCWGTGNATLSLDGVGGGELIYNASEKRWHTRSDDGTLIERLYNATNGDTGTAPAHSASTGWSP